MKYEIEENDFGKNFFRQLNTEVFLDLYYSLSPFAKKSKKSNIIDSKGEQICELKLK